MNYAKLSEHQRKQLNDSVYMLFLDLSRIHPLIQDGDMLMAIGRIRSVKMMLSNLEHQVECIMEENRQQ